MSRLAFASLCWLLPAAALAAEGRIQVELAMPATFPVLGQQQWYQLFSELGVDGLQIRKAAVGDKAEIKTAGSKAAPVYHVVGMLGSNGQLDLPGGRFSSRDRARIAAWLAKLKAGGPAALTGGGGPTPFGLSAAQFANVNAELSTVVADSTKGLTPGELLQKLSTGLEHPFVVDRAVLRRLAASAAITDELQGLTTGTALAYAVRAEGLALVPRSTDSKRIEYLIVQPTEKQTTWPVGWSLEDKKPKDVVPALFELLNAEIDDIPLTEAIEAVCGRLKVPVLYDHYALARQGIDLAKLQAKFPARKTWYGKIIDRILHQCGLTGQWRLDDAGKPLLWVTTLKPVK